jgi:Uma2 family endonuclease
MPALSPRYTIEMLDAMPQEPGARYELVDGLLIVTPAPRPVHAEIVDGVIHALHIGVPRTAARVASPGEIRFGHTNSLQPDILVYPATFRGKTTWKEVTEWWLAVEVVSPSSRGYDREEKRLAYLAHGVPTYWVVDPETRTIEVWHTSSSKPRIVHDSLAWTTPSGHRVEIELEGLFRDVPRES